MTVSCPKMTRDIASLARATFDSDVVCAGYDVWLGGIVHTM